MKKKIVIAGACRTAIGKMGGSLSKIPAAQLGALVIREAVKRAGVPSASVDQVYMGCVLQAAQGQNIARQASIAAGIPVETPAVTVNVVCGSGLHCVNLAAQMISAGEADIVVAGGTENMSLAPYALEQARFGYRLNNGSLIDTMVRDALWDSFHDYHMGITAENIAERWRISRGELDEFAAESHKKASIAQKNGCFDDEIVPVEIKTKGEILSFRQDEGIRPDTTPESIARLCPAFLLNGVVTAANSSSINDGAAAVVLMSEEMAREYGVKPLGYWLAGALTGVEPEIMGIGPVAATQKVLKKTGLTVDDFSVIEANEAFAAQSIAVGRELGIKPAQLNPNGGAIALGHPVGASGCRILVTLLYEMRRRNSEYGLATLCIGGGMGCSTAVRRA